VWAVQPSWTSKTSSQHGGQPVRHAPEVGIHPPPTGRISAVERHLRCARGTGSVPRGASIRHSGFPTDRRARGHAPVRLPAQSGGPPVMYHGTCRPSAVYTFSKVAAMRSWSPGASIAPVCAGSTAAVVVSRRSSDAGSKRAVSPPRCGASSRLLAREVVGSASSETEPATPQATHQAALCSESCPRQTKQASASRCSTTGSVRPRRRAGLEW